MEKFNLWIARHKKLSLILFPVPLAFLFAFIYTLLEAPVGIIILFMVIWSLITFIGISGIEIILLDKPIKALNDCCDHTDFSQMVETLLSYKVSKGTRMTLLINRATALSCDGEIEKAYDVLQSVNIDLFYNLDAKFIYYNNLASFCEALGKKEEALIWYNKVLSIYSDLKDGKFKRTFKGYADLSVASIAALGDDYHKAAEILENMQYDNFRQKVEGNYFYADVCIKLGDNQKAKEKLNFVMVHGNKLHIVAKAKEKLQKLEIV